MTEEEIRDEARKAANRSHFMSNHIYDHKSYEDGFYEGMKQALRQYGVMGCRFKIMLWAGFVKPTIIMTENLNFGQAIEALKQGQRVARQGWNGKGMHIFLEEHFTALINMGGRKLERKYEPVICMWTAQQTTQPGWLASQADILANDWCIVD